MDKIAGNEFKMVAKTMFGLEEVLSTELLKLGARNIEKHNRAVSFEGDKGFLYKANLCCRTALNILIPIKNFTAQNQEELYAEMKTIEWEKYIHADNTLAVDCSLNSQYFNHSLFVAQKTKDAVADRFKERFGRRPSVDLEKPDLKIDVHVYKDTFTVSLNSSGQSLYKRGYKEETNKAPMNEVLAAGLVLLSDWDRRTNFIDPMCGSGTIVIEAALIANNIPPGYFREKFGFETWLDFDKPLWETIYASAIEKINNNNPVIIGADISNSVSRIAAQNVKNAKVEDIIKIINSSFENLEVPPGRGILVMNPPYGERLDKDDINALYKSIGDTLKKKYSGYDAWIISSNEGAMKSVGLRPTRRIALYNGALECRFMKFSMYEGTKKIHKLNANGS